MNLVTASPLLVAIYVAVLLWILMDLRFAALRPTEKIVIPLLILLLGIGNHLLRVHLGAETYAPLIFLTLHLPYFFIFLYLTRCGPVKMAFMIFTAVVFTAPTVHVSNALRTEGVADRVGVMLLANLLITPLYLTMIGVPTTVGDVAKMIPTILLPFNFVKATLNGSVVLLLYKPISSAMRKSGFLPKKENQGRDTKNKIRSIWITLIALTVIIVSFLIIFLVLT